MKHIGFLPVILLAILLISPSLMLVDMGPSATVPNQTFNTSQVSWQELTRAMNVTTFVSPDGSKDALWNLLRSAKESIFVEIFGINNPYILDLIHQLRAERPSLKMKFLIGWNSIGYVDPNKYVANNLTLLGIPVRWTNSADFTYAHQKFIIIDNKTTVVHSGNWAKTSFPEVGKKANREWSIAMTDTQVTAVYRAVFDYDWSRGTPYDNITHGIGSPLSYTQDGSTYPRPFSTSGHFNGTMKVIPVFSPVTSLDGILYVINSAQATLDIQIPYFTNVGGTGAVKQVVDAIIAAKNRGVTVRVITEEEKDFELIAEILHSHKIPIVWQDTRWFTANHNKGIIADGQIVLICSINFSDGSISSNREAGVIIEHQGVAGWYQEVYDYDWGIGDCDVQDSVNLYWSPNIPTSSDPIQITVYGHMLYPSITQVTIDYRINDGAWVNGTDITANVVNSAEGDPENYVFTLPAQPDKTNITVVAHIVAAGVTHTSHPMVIPVRNELGRPTVPVDPLMGYGWIIALVVAIVVGLIGGPRVYKRKLSSTRVTSSTRLGEVMSPTRPSESMSSAGPSGGSPPTESRRSTSTKSTRRKSSTGPAEGTSSGTGKTRKSRSGSKKT